MRLWSWRWHSSGASSAQAVSGQAVAAEPPASVPRGVDDTRDSGHQGARRVGIAVPALVAASLAATAILFAAVASHLEVRTFIHDISTPVFKKVDLPALPVALDAMEQHLHRVSGHQWLRQLAPNQGGALWLSLLVLIIVGLDARGWSARTRDLLLTQVTAWALFGTLDVFSQTDAPPFLAWVRLMFELGALATALIWLRTFWLQWRPYPTAPHSRKPTSFLLMS